MVEIHDSVESARKKADPKAALEMAVKASLEDIQQKFIVMSGKGGVGKSSTAVNLAIALASKGARVGLMDVDLHGPDVPRMLGYNGVLDLNKDNKLIPIQFGENLTAVSVEALMEGKDDAIIWRGPVKHSMIQQFIGMVQWGKLDFLIVDAPPGTGDEPLTVAQSIKDAQAIVVTTPQEVSLADVRKSINFCKTVKMALYGIIENMSGFHCPHCSCELDLFGTGGGKRMASELGIPFLGGIPFDPQLVECGDNGIAYQEKFPESQATQAYARIAEKMIAGLPVQAG